MLFPLISMSVTSPHSAALNLQRKYGQTEDIGHSEDSIYIEEKRNGRGVSAYAWKID